jgi:Tat protein translocase TatB subunit
MLNIGPQELLIILIIALVVVGPQRLPELGRSIGRSLRELRRAQDEVKRTIRGNLDDETPNGSSARRASAGAAGPTGGQVSEPGATIPPVVGDVAPTASDPPPANEIREISRSLGQSLSELRRAKEEVQRSFRVDLTGSSKPRPTRRATPRPSTPEHAREPSQPPAEGHAPSTTEGSADAEPAAPDRATD